MSFTNSQLAQKIAQLIDYWKSFNQEYANWLGGSTSGGENSDGRYPLTDWQGNTKLVKSPARLEDDVDSLVNQADGAAAQATDAASQAQSSADAASTQSSLAEAARVAAETAQTNAQTAESGAVDAKVVAIAQANVASSKATTATAAADTAVAARDDAEAARDLAQGYADAAQAYDPTNFAEVNHIHDWTEIQNKPSTFTPSAHTHSAGDITSGVFALALIPDLSTLYALAGHTHSWSQITDKPTEFTPEAHTHAWGEITGKPTAFTPSVHTHLWADITDKPSTFTPSAHTHSASEITSGVLSYSRLPTTIARIDLANTFQQAQSFSSGFTVTSGNVEFADSVTIQGDLYVNGTTTQLNVQSLDVEDNIILLNKNVTGSPALNAGLEVERGTATNVQLIWNETADSWQATDSSGTLRKIYHSGNDGAGSGLDADTLDGLQATDFAAASHNHAWTEITGKPSTFTPSAHTHVWADITDKPSTFTPASHTHSASDITSGTLAAARLPDLSGTYAVVGHTHSWSQITGKPSTFAPSAHTHSWSEITSKPSTFAPSAHTHSASDITSGTLSSARLPDLSDTYLAVGAKAADADKLDGLHAASFVRIGQAVGSADANVVSFGGTTGLGFTLNSTGSTNYPQQYGFTVHFSAGAGDNASSWQRDFDLHKEGTQQEWYLRAYNTADGTPYSWCKIWHSGNFNPSNYASALHTHAWSEITGKPSTFTPSSHTHLWADITDKPSTFTPSSHTHAWTEITGKPSTFEPSAHTHSAADITSGTLSASRLPDLSSTYSVVGHAHAWTEITGKPSTFTPSSHTHLWADITDKPSTFTPSSHTHAWTEITGKPSTFTPSSHSHSAADITSGTLSDARLSASSIPARATELPSGVDLNNYQTAGFYYQTANADASAGSNYPVAQAGSLTVQLSAGVTQQYYTYNDGTPEIYFRGFYNSNWSDWRRVLHSSNYNEYVPTKTGGGASGTWDIAISGNAATATSATSATTAGSCTGNAATATWADTVDVNGGNTSGSWYDVVWHSGDTLYSSTGVEINGSVNGLRASRLQITENAGYFYGDSNYTRFTGSSFYIDSGVPNCYIYASNTYLGGSSGDVIRLRGNTLIGDGGFNLLNGNMTVNAFTIDNATPQINFHTDNYSAAYIKAMDGGSNGANIVVKAGGNLVLGSGESTAANAVASGNTSENVHIGSDGTIYFYSNAQTWGSRKTSYIHTNGDYVSASRLMAYGNRVCLNHASSSYASGSITFSTSSPSGGSDGDIWFKY